MRCRVHIIFRLREAAVVCFAVEAFGLFLFESGGEIWPSGMLKYVLVL